MSIAAAVGGVGGVFIAPTKRERERERERESSFFFGRKFRISFYFLICFINPNGGFIEEKEEEDCTKLLFISATFKHRFS